MNKKLLLCAPIFALALSGVSSADDHGKGDGRTNNHCPVTHSALENAIQSAQAQANGGLGFHMWASVVNSDGVVCAVAKSGNGLNSQWLGSRVISAQKAYTANAFSLDNGLALSTANLYAAVQPGGSLFGLQHSNPVDTQWAYAGNANKFGRSDDPMTGRRIGGINVFGGGLALYDANHKLVGAVGVSGDTSCTDHNIAWRVRDTLKLSHVPAGLSGTAGDNVIYDLKSATPSGFGHPECYEKEGAPVSHITNQSIVDSLPLAP
jgi:uncharacterized protein GlcG (DUF336 family)